MSEGPGSVPLIHLYYQFDLASTSYVYNRYGRRSRGWGGIKTSGSSTTITSVSGLSTPPFNDLAVGDLLDIRYSATPGTVVATNSIRRVATWTDADTIVANSAITLTAGTAAWDFRKKLGGTAATDGWCYIGDLYNATLWLDFPTLGETDGVTYVVQVKGGDDLAQNPYNLGAPVVVAASAAPYQAKVELSSSAGPTTNFVRLGVKSTTASTGTDSLSAYITGRQVH